MNWVETWFNIASHCIKEGLENRINIYLCCSIVDCVLHENNRWVLSLHSLLVCVGNKRVTALLFYSSLHPSHKCRQFPQFSDLEKLLQRQLFGFPSLYFLLLSILQQLVFNSSFLLVLVAFSQSVIKSLSFSATQQLSASRYVCLCLCVFGSSKHSSPPSFNFALHTPHDWSYCMCWRLGVPLITDKLLLVSVFHLFSGVYVVAFPIWGFDWLNMWHVQTNRGWLERRSVHTSNMRFLPTWKKTPASLLKYLDINMFHFIIKLL